jgi:hypothetical protein
MSPRIGQTLVSPEGRQFKVLDLRGYDNGGQPVIRLQRLDRRAREQACIWRPEAEVESWASRVLAKLQADGVGERPKA